MVELNYLFHNLIGTNFSLFSGFHILIHVRRIYASVRIHKRVTGVLLPQVIEP